VKFTTAAEMEALHDPYYTGRWEYYLSAINYCELLPGGESFAPQDVLEIGPYTLPLVPGCDTMDYMDHGVPVTYRHDASNTPWPVERKYRLIVALQVWEHLGDKQRYAWAEVARLADWAILSVPFKWPSPQDHAGIDWDKVYEWTRREPLFTTLVRSSIAPLDRLVSLYDLRGLDGAT